MGTRCRDGGGGGGRGGAGALEATYAVLGELPADERIAFALRFIEGMELTEVAASCGVSLATVKRRIGRAEGRSVEKARQHPILAEVKEVPDGQPQDRPTGSGGT
ncbi:MAG: sigma-70 region 4 domain-containing protein [Polyangiaceae bacterium]